MENKQKITVVAIGAGNRMNAYTEYAILHPEELCMVAVVEPNDIRRTAYARRFAIPSDRCFAAWEEFIKCEKIADAVFLCTPDDMHYTPAMYALEKGYDILLEKPIARSWQECLDIAEQAKRCHRIVSVCHVLRYNPYFIKFKEIVAGGTLGEIISVNHVEAVGIERMTHAFVRGWWRREDETNPMILSKSCHDLDWLVWLTDRRCLRVHSYGSLKWFKKENAPQGSALRCTDNCAVEKSCPYSAINLYLRQKRWLRHFDIPEGINQEDVILQELKEGPYGRCVYHCDNDVVDHQVVSMLMEDDITVNFSLDAFTKESGRRTHVMCSGGEIWGDERTLTIRYFNPDKEDEVYDFSFAAAECSFHGGADLRIVADFIEAVRTRRVTTLLTPIDSSLESHRIAFEIERSRREHR